VDERAALRLLLLDLKMEVVGEAADWPKHIDSRPRPPLWICYWLDWDLLPVDLGLQALGRITAYLYQCNHRCSESVFLDAHQQAAISTGSGMRYHIKGRPRTERVRNVLQPQPASIPCTLLSSWTKNEV